MIKSRIFLFVLALLGTLFIAQAARSATWTLGAPVQVETGIHATGVATGWSDWYRDKPPRAGIVLPDSSNNSVSVFVPSPPALNSWSFSGSYPVGNGPAAVATAISHIYPFYTSDPITANSGDNTVSVLLRTWDRVYKPRKDYHLAGTGPILVGASDFGNGYNATHFYGIYTATSAGIEVLKDDGSGNFALLPPTPLSSHSVTCNITAAVARDLDSDGVTDFAVLDNYTDATGTNYELTILHGNDNGTFSTLTPQPLTVQATELVACNFSGEGALDLALLSGADGRVSIYRGNGDGTFTPGAALTVPPNARKIIAGDMDCSGNKFLVVSSGESTLSAFLCNADGTFQPRQDVVVPGGAHWLVASDFSGDWVADIVTGDRDQTNFSILPSTLTYHLETAADPPTGGNSVSPGGDYPAQSETTITAIPGPGNFLEYWSGVPDYDGSSLATVPVRMYGDYKATAHFRPNYVMTTLVNPPGAGVVSATGAFNPSGTTTLTASANPGWAFDSWSAIGPSFSIWANPTTLTMTQDMTVTAWFTRTDDITLSMAQQGAVVNLKAGYHRNGSPVPDGTTLKVNVKYSLDGVTWPATWSSKTLGKTLGGVVNAKRIKARNGYYKFRALYAPKGKPAIPGEEIIDCKVMPVGGVNGPIDKTVSTENAPAISWQAYDGAIGYDVQISTSKKFTTLLATNHYDGAGSTSGTLPALTAGLKTYWRVVARLDGDSTSVGSTPRQIVYAPAP